jgi:hypothetical protein
VRKEQSTKGEQKYREKDGKERKRELRKNREMQ